MKSLPWLAALGLAGCSGMRGVYEREVQAEIAKSTPMDTGRITEASLVGLPEPVRRHFRECGFVGKPCMRNARIAWETLELKRGRDKGWMRVKTRQFNSVPEPARIVLMQGRLLGFLPFEGRDKYQDGHGNMRIRALGLFQVADVRSSRMDSSALVTVLAEALLVPSYALQDYIRWEAVDGSTAIARLEWGGIRIAGTFHFDAAGRCVRFSTRDRWQDGNDSGPVPWSAYFPEYAEREDMRFPAALRAVWHEKDGDFEYARGRIEHVEFDVREP